MCASIARMSYELDRTTSAWPALADVAILGAGAAGMMVALAAAGRGLSVLLCDPLADQPNNFAISGGLFPAAGSALQRAGGVGDDSPERWLSDLRAFAPGAVNERIAAAVAHVLPEATDFLLRTLGAGLRWLPDMQAPGHGALRFHSVTPASGAAFHAQMRERVLASPAIHWWPRRVDTRRLPGGGFELAGEGVSTPLRVRQLVLAGGGFGADAELVARFIPGMAGALNNGSPTNNGSTLRLGLEWGAQVWGMDGYQGQGHTHPGGATRLGMSIPTLGGLMLNRAGRRFVREDVGPSALAPLVLAQPDGLALEVFDAAIEAQLGNHSAYQQARADGRVIEANSIAELAGRAGVDEVALQATLDEATRCAQGLAEDPLGRARFARVLQAPWRASWVTGALSHTQGGLLTDEDGRVLGAGDRWIDGVYAVGGCAAGLSGRGADGYLPGNGLAQAFGLGWRLARALG